MIRSQHFELPQISASDLSLLFIHMVSCNMRQSAGISMCLHGSTSTSSSNRPASVFSNCRQNPLDLQGIKTVVTVNDQDLVTTYATEAKSVNEVWVNYQDDIPPLRAKHPGDPRAALTPWLANQVHPFAFNLASGSITPICVFNREELLLLGTSLSATWPALMLNTSKILDQPA